MRILFFLLALLLAFIHSGNKNKADNKPDRYGHTYSQSASGQETSTEAPPVTTVPQDEKADNDPPPEKEVTVQPVIPSETPVTDTGTPEPDDPDGGDKTEPDDTSPVIGIDNTPETKETTVVTSDTVDDNDGYVVLPRITV